MNIFITGGTSGIGLALAQHYLAKDYDVGLCGRNEEKLQQAFPEGYPAKLRYYKVDVVQLEDVQRAVEDFFKATGHIHLLIANAGISSEKTHRIPEINKCRRIMRTNVEGVLNTLDAAIPKILKNDGTHKGQIVIIGSVAGFVGLPRAGAYCASKSYLEKYTQTLAIDLKPYGIDTTYIAPGFVQTPLTDKNKHPMPFLMPVAKAAKHIAWAIEKKKLIYVFPWQMRFLSIFLRLLPYSLYVIFMRLFTNKKKFNFEKAAGQKI